jgi:hypothetical protein
MLDARCLILDKGNRVAVQDRVGESSFATLQLRRDRSSIKYRVSRFWFIAVAFLATTSHVGAQELLPAAYTPAPYGINLLSYAITHNDGDMTFDPSAPIEDVTAKITSSALGYARTLGIAGRAANIGVVVPYVVGHLEGLYLGEPAAASRSCLGDLAFRCTVNLYGAPSMSPQEFGSYRPRTLIGVSLVVRAPTGQYMPERLLNIGGNRWAFKPEIGVVHIMGRWAIDAYLGGWFFTDNTDFFGGKTHDQDPMISTQFHVRYLFKPGLWGALDGNFWRGGQTTVDGVVNDDKQHNSRVGATVSIGIGRSHSLRVAASRGAITRIGGDFVSIGVSYGYSWVKKPSPI